MAKVTKGQDKVTDEKEAKKVEAPENKTKEPERVVETDEDEEERESLKANLPGSPKNAEKSDQEVSREIL